MENLWYVISITVALLVGAWMADADTKMDCMKNGKTIFSGDVYVCHKENNNGR